MKRMYVDFIATFFILSGLCFMTFVLGDMGRPLEFKSGFNMQMEERRRYLLKTSGCNDCQTAGYTSAEGKLPSSCG